MKTRARLIAGALLLAITATGCGGGADESSASAPDASASSSRAPTSATASATPTPAGATLVEICPQVEAALPRDLMIPDAAQLTQIRAAMQPILESSDLEARNALQLFLDGIDKASAAYQDTTDPVPAVTASEAFDDGLSAFAHRCKAAGSTALQ